jgi:hypothetical protein
MIYEYFKDCPDKPRYKSSNANEYYFKINTGGPIREVKEEKVISRDVITRAVLRI